MGARGGGAGLRPVVLPAGGQPSNGQTQGEEEPAQMRLGPQGAKDPGGLHYQHHPGGDANDAATQQEDANRQQIKPAQQSCEGARGEPGGNVSAYHGRLPFF